MENTEVIKKDDLHFDGRQTDVGIIDLFDRDWTALKPRLKFQRLQDSPLSQMVFEAICPENMKSSRTFAHAKYLNGQGKSIAALALITQRQSTPFDWRMIIYALFEELEARDP